MMDYTITKTLDVQKLNCPLPILKTKKAIYDIEIGEYLEILTTDPGSVSDFQAWCNSTGNELVVSSQENGIFKYIIKKTK